MPRPDRHRLVAASAAVLVISCLAAPIAPEATDRAPGVLPEAAASPTAPADLLPEIAISDLVLQAGESQGEWLVLGMATNRSASALEAIRLRVETVGTDGAPTGETTASLPLSVLQPRASSPFTATFHSSSAPASARASLESFLLSSAEALHPRLGDLHTTRVPDGVFVRGTVQAGDPGPLRVDEIVIAWRGAGRALAGWAVASVPGAAIDQGEGLPWTAFAPGAGAESRFEVFTAASVHPEGGSAVVMVDGPVWRATGQGNRFVTGAVRNDGAGAVFPQLAIAAFGSGRPISMQILESRVPLQPGEVLIFAADRLPGLESILDAEGLEAADLTLQAYLDARPVPPDMGLPVLLPVSIRRFEVIGSSVFVGGSIDGPESVTLQVAELFVSMRSTEGEPLSARWLALNPPPARAGVEFSADLPIPSGVDAAMCEYDVRAIGLPLPDPSR